MRANGDLFVEQIVRRRRPGGETLFRAGCILAGAVLAVLAFFLLGVFFPLAMAVIALGEFELDERARILTRNGSPIELTQVEYQMVSTFFENAGKALSREDILHAVWGDGYKGDVKIVDVNVRRLRIKLEENPAVPTHLLTVWGYGYKWA